MAGRIRTIKPDFWTDSKVVQLSPYARLLFQGIWNFADDTGVIEDDVMQLKLQILPADPVDIESLVDELLKLDMIRRAIAADGVRVLVVRQWEHQKISRPSKPRHGGREALTYPPLTEESVSDHGGLSEGSVSPHTCRSEAIHGGLSESSMLKGREGKGYTPPTEVADDPQQPAEQSMDLGIPLSKAEDEPSYAATVAKWALAHGRARPTTNDRAQRYRWVLDVVTVELPAGPQLNGRARQVICDYIAEMYDRPPNVDEIKVLGVMCNGHPHGAVLDAVVEGVERGIGLDPDPDHGDKGLVLYARGVLNGRRGEAA